MIDNLRQIFKFLNDSSNVDDIRAVLDEVFPLEAIYIYDTTTNSLRDFSKSWKMLLKNSKIKTFIKQNINYTTL